MAGKKMNQSHSSNRNAGTLQGQLRVNDPTPEPGTNRRKRKDAEAPSTPQKRRVRTSKQLMNPNPAAVAMISESAYHGMAETRKPKPAAINCPANIDATNAVLLSPESLRVTASEAADAVSPFSRSKTSNILEQACAHLIRVDERMRPLIDQNYCRLFSPDGLAEEIDPFESLISSIISQQVSGAAAKTIKARFTILFQDTAEAERRFPVPSQVVAASIEKLRTAGLSQRKAEYVQGLADKFVTGNLSAQMLADESYDKVLERLTAVRGLGRWSVEMFACFALKRPDVFSLGDLGVQRGMAAFIGRDVSKLKSKGGKWKYMSEKEMKELSDRFKPFRSIFMWYMWRVEETDVSTLG